MPPDNNTVSKAVLENITPREINVLLNIRTPRQRRELMSQLTARQRVHLKQWQREHPGAANSDQSLTGLLLLAVVVLVVVVFVVLLLAELPRIITHH
jgi:Flp pilus assembly protein TadB